MSAKDQCAGERQLQRDEELPQQEKKHQGDESQEQYIGEVIHPGIVPAGQLRVDHERQGLHGAVKLAAFPKEGVLLEGLGDISEIAQDVNVLRYDVPVVKTDKSESLKYFLLGAFATGFIVYGIALIYGSVHTTSIETIISKFSSLKGDVLFIAGILLFLIGFSFKIAAFPFHMWVPDVYQGSSTTIAGLFSTGGKAAAFSAIIATLSAVFSNTQVHNLFEPYLAVIAVFSMLFGSIVAISQSNIKRMLAYSSIAHAGYMIIGLAAGNYDGIAGIIFYLSAYTFMNLGAFGIIALIEGENETNLDINNYAGLGSRKPLLAALLSICMFSLAGIPPFAGFFGKYYVFISAIKAHLTWLAIVGVFSSAISLYFYLRIVVLMYFKDPTEEMSFSISNSGLLAVIVSVLLVIVLGIAPGTFISLISSFL